LQVFRQRLAEAHPELAGLVGGVAAAGGTPQARPASGSAFRPAASRGNAEVPLRALRTLPHCLVEPPAAVA